MKRKVFSYICKCIRAMAKQEVAADTHPVKSYILHISPSLGDTGQKDLLFHFSNKKTLFAMKFFAHCFIPLKTCKIFLTYI